MRDSHWQRIRNNHQHSSCRGEIRWTSSSNMALTCAPMAAACVPVPPSWITSVEGLCPAGKTWLLWRKQTGGWKVSWMCLCTPPFHQGVYTHTHTWLTHTLLLLRPAGLYRRSWVLRWMLNYYCTAGSRIWRKRHSSNYANRKINMNFYYHECGRRTCEKYSSCLVHS